MYELKQFIASNVKMEFIYNDEIKNVNTDKKILTFQIVKY